MYTSVFEVKSLCLINQYQNAIPSAMPLHKLKKVPTSRVFHTHDIWFYWWSENPVHERFIAEQRRGVWIENAAAFEFESSLALQLDVL